MQHQIRAQIERTHQIRSGERRIDQQRQPGIVSDARHSGDVQHFEPGIAQRFAEHEPGIRTDRRRECGRLARIHERGRDAEARQRVRQQVVRAAVDRTRRDDVVAGRAQRRHRQVHGRLPARRRDRADAAFERRDALFEHRVGRIRQPRIDVPGAFDVEQARGKVGIRKHERRRLIDRRRSRAGGRIRSLPGVQRQRVEAALVCHQRSSSELFQITIS